MVNLRTGLVLGKDGGLLPKLTLLTRLMLGGTLGSGKQYFPWISVTDEIAAMIHLLTAPVHGPVNLTGPYPVTNAEFTKELGRALGRPTPWMIPGFALHIVLGEFAGRGPRRAAGAADQAARVGIRVQPPDAARGAGRRVDLNPLFARERTLRRARAKDCCQLRPDFATVARHISAECVCGDAPSEEAMAARDQVPGVPTPQA